MHFIATANQLVAALDGSTPLAVQQRYPGAVSVTNFREFLRLPGKLVIKTGCSLGAQAYALSYAYHVRGKSLHPAHLASQTDPDTAMFKLYSRET